MNLLLVAPILIPLVAAVLSMLLRESRRAQHGIAVAGGLGMLASAIALLDAAADGSIHVVRIGD
jgi:formate hydrogenlyase subunit 3/multisubunit Na+/H+ antiporter MnhD subunit